MLTKMTGRRLEIHTTAGGREFVPPPRVITITPAQKRVLDQLVRDGATNATIAGRLGLKRSSVVTHVAALLGRLGLDNRAAIVAEVLHGRVRFEISTQQERTQK